MADTTLTVRADAPLGTISPRLYGHFAEHIGRCCYDGLWVGPECREVPHEAGFWRDVLDALRALPVPLWRWPGGCYADHFHWRDGIGPPAERPRRLGCRAGCRCWTTAASAPTSSSGSAPYSAPSRTWPATSAAARGRSYATGSSTATAPSTPPWPASARPTAPPPPSASASGASATRTGLRRQRRSSPARRR